MEFKQTFWRNNLVTRITKALPKPSGDMLDTVWKYHFFSVQVFSSLGLGSNFFPFGSSNHNSKWQGLLVRDLDLNKSEQMCFQGSLKL